MALQYLTDHVHFASPRSQFSSPSTFLGDFSRLVFEMLVCPPRNALRKVSEDKHPTCTPACHLVLPIVKNARVHIPHEWVLLVQTGERHTTIQ